MGENVDPYLPIRVGCPWADRPMGRIAGLTCDPHPLISSRVSAVAGGHWPCYRRQPPPPSLQTASTPPSPASAASSPSHVLLSDRRRPPAPPECTNDTSFETAATGHGSSPTALESALFSTTPSSPTGDELQLHRHAGKTQARPESRRRPKDVDLAAAGKLNPI